MLILFCFFFQLCSPVNTPTELSAQIDMTLLRFTLSSPRGETSPPMAERRLLPLRDARRSPRGKWSQRTRTFTAPRLSVINAKLAAKKQHEVPRGPLPLLVAKTAEIFKSLDHQLWALEILWSTASLGTLCLLWYAASKKKKRGGQWCVSNLSCERVEVGWRMVSLFLASCCVSGFEILEMWLRFPLKTGSES